MAAYINIPATTVGATFAASNALSRAQTILGPTVTKVFGTDFGDTGGVSSTVAGGSATANLSTTVRGGVINASTGATIGNTVVIRPAGIGGQVINPTTELWFFRSKATFTTSVDAQTYNAVSIGQTGSTSGLFIGGIGARSTVNFSYEFYNNPGAVTSFGSLGVALDTSSHIFEMWGDLTNFNVAIDGTIRLTLAIPALTTNAHAWRIDASNGTTAANKEVDVDEIYICTAA
jgi:hypothetical protein